MEGRGSFEPKWIPGGEVACEAEEGAARPICHVAMTSRLPFGLHSRGGGRTIACPGKADVFVVFQRQLSCCELLLSRHERGVD